MTWTEDQGGPRPGGRRGRRRTQSAAGFPRGGTAVLSVLFLLSCSAPPPQDHDHAHQQEHSHEQEHEHEHGESWSVTAWGERFEVFPDVDALAAGHAADAHTHVTRLADFSALTNGRVEIVLRDASGEQVFGTDEPVRPGVFDIEVTPRRSGEAELLFRIRDGGGTEEIAGGRVRVGTHDHAGGPIDAPGAAGESDRGEPIPFLKEQQWRSSFATAWVREGSLAESVTGLATVRPPAGGESTVTAPTDGVVRPAGDDRTWPFVGRGVQEGTPLFRVVPLVASERSLAALEAELENLVTELDSARARLARLEELLALEATSEREVEEARVRAETLEVRHRAAAQDLEQAQAAREGGPGGRGLSLRAPFSGRVASVSATPGATVAAGDPLARVVRTNPVWIEVALPPDDARRLAAGGVRGLVLEDPEAEPVRIEEGLSLVSVAPELSPRTGTVTVLLQAPTLAGAGFALGSTAAAQVLMAGEVSGIVIPASALVDDGGVSVVYLQVSGEEFVRQQVTVLERQGNLVRVERLVPGQRLVTRGGDAIRRSSLMASGEVEGHVH